MKTGVSIELSSEIRSDYSGFNQIAKIGAETKTLEYGSLEIDMSHVKWFDANMMAPFGGVLFDVDERVNEIRLTHFNEAVKKVLSKNSFLCNFGSLKEDDHYKTTIPFQRFGLEDRKYFSRYLDDSLARIENEFNKVVFPEKTKNEFKGSLFEIFNNALEHSASKLGIFACGQIYIRQQKLAFTIADLGIGIPGKVNKETGHRLSATECIRWALGKDQKTGRNHTTKTGPRPGGLGLKRVQDFLSNNHGKLQIVSGNGFYENTGEYPFVKDLAYPLIGTTVNMEIIYKKNS